MIKRPQWTGLGLPLQLFSSKNPFILTHSLWHTHAYSHSHSWTRISSIENCIKFHKHVKQFPCHHGFAHDVVKSPSCHSVFFTYLFFFFFNSLPFSVFQTFFHGDLSDKVQLNIYLLILNVFLLWHV